MCVYNNIEEEFNQIYEALICKRSTKIGCYRLMNILNQMGNFHEAFQVIHVAGTNGKSSVTYKTYKILETFGVCNNELVIGDTHNTTNNKKCNVGAFVSPHLFDYRERIQINSKWISKIDYVAIYKYLNYVFEYELRHLNFFDITLIICLIYFMFGHPIPKFDLTSKAIMSGVKPYCDYIVIETGIGGQYDSTNIFKKPICSIITSIGFDHMNLLGETLEEIASEKAGIIKPQCCIILGPGVRKLRTVNDAIEKVKPSLVLTSEFQSIDYNKENNALVEVVVQYLLLRKHIMSPSLEDIKHSIESHRLLCRSFELSKEQSKMIIHNMIIQNTHSSIHSSLIDTNNDHLLSVLIDVGHNVTAMERLAKFCKEKYKDTDLSLVVCLSKNRNLDIFLPFFTSNINIKGFYYVTCQHSTTLPFSYILEHIKGANICNLTDQQKTMYTVLLNSLDTIMPQRDEVVFSELDSNMASLSQNLSISMNSLNTLNQHVAIKSALPLIILDSYIKKKAVIICGTVFMMTEVFNTLEISETMYIP